MDLIKLYKEKADERGKEHKIRLFFKNDSYIYCFVEGKDSEYYYPKIKNYTEEEIKFFNSGGRENVLENYSIVEKLGGYSDYKKLFFVDKDFNIDQLPHGIYETPCYSIENLYVNEKVISSILQYSWHIEEIDVQRAIILYKTVQAEYHKHALEMNAFIKLQKKLSRDRTEEISLNLNDIHLKDVYKISTEKASKKLEFEDWVDKCDKIINAY